MEYNFFSRWEKVDLFLITEMTFKTQTNHTFVCSVLLASKLGYCRKMYLRFRARLSGTLFMKKNSVKAKD